MKAALVGLPQSGKSLLLSAISGHAPAPCGSTRLVEAVVPAPDPRLDRLTALYQPRRTVRAAIDCIDAPGLSFAEPAGRAAARKCLDQLRTADMFVLVVRAFEGGDPERQLCELQSEFLLADLQMVETRIERLERKVLKATDTLVQDRAELDVHRKLRAGLENGHSVRSLVEADDLALIHSLNLLTLKPSLVVVNISEDQLGRSVAPRGVIEDKTETIPICVQLEAELAQLDGDDRIEFMRELGIDEPVIHRFVRSCYASMGLIEFLTVGPDEVRAWPIPVGATAVEAAGKVHSDIQRGFIRAETIAYDDLLTLGSEQAVKAAGRLRLEGKTYIVQDGDIMNFRFSV